MTRYLLHVIRTQPLGNILMINGKLITALAVAKAGAKLVSFQELAPVRRMSGHFLAKKSQ